MIRTMSARVPCDTPRGVCPQPPSALCSRPRMKVIPRAGWPRAPFPGPQRSERSAPVIRTGESHSPAETRMPPPGARTRYLQCTTSASDVRCLPRQHCVPSAPNTGRRFTRAALHVASGPVCSRAPQTAPYVHVSGRPSTTSERPSARASFPTEETSEHANACAARRHWRVLRWSAGASLSIAQPAQPDRPSGRGNALTTDALVR